MIADVLHWIAALLEGVLLYLSALWLVIWHSLTLDPKLLAVVQAQPRAIWVTTGVAVLAGASTLLGHSVVLFVNRVRGARFLFSLIVNGLMLVIIYVVEALVIWGIGLFLLDAAPTAGDMIRGVMLASAPLVFGFLVLIPYAGPAIGRLLSVWSFLIVWGVVKVTFGVDLWTALAVAGLGWLAMLLLSNTVGRPVVWLRNRIWKLVTGSSLDVTAQDILLDYAISRPAAAAGASEAP
jgi:hypothetical protein